MKPPFQTVVDNLDLLERLAGFSPTVIGTPPLGLAIETSDIDIACTASDLAGFGEVARQHFDRFPAFATSQCQIAGEPSLIASFMSFGWTIELFCQRLDVEDQAGVRHFRIERRLLDLAPSLRPEVLRLKRLGLKTEPAFAKLLGLSGDPYDAMFALGSETDEALRTMISQAQKKNPAGAGF